MSVFNACYDLACSPPTYDVLGFLLWAEAKRVEWGCEHVAIEIAPGPAGGFRQDNFWPHTVAERVAMRDNVAVPLCRLLPSCCDVRVLNERPAVAGEAFGRPLYGLKYLVDGWKKGIRPLRSLAAFPPDPWLVTITLRESEHWPARNSNVAEWCAAASVIERTGFVVVFVRDTLRADEDVPGFSKFSPASKSIAARAYLYSRARVNLGVSNGPMWLVFCQDAPAIVFKPADDRLGQKQFSSAYLASCGLPPGEQIPGVPSYQRLAWCDDTAANIVSEFFRFIEADHGGAGRRGAELVQEHSDEAQAGVGQRAAG